MKSMQRQVNIKIEQKRQYVNTEQNGQQCAFFLILKNKANLRDLIAATGLAIFLKLD